MIDFADISPDLIVARGQYATVRSALDDSLKSMQSLCGAVAARSAEILRVVQDGEDTAPLFEDARKKLSAMESLSKEIIALRAQKEELKPFAWR